MGRYRRMAEFLRERMEVVGFKSNRDFQRALARIGCAVGENMVSRWLTGQARPQGGNLTAVLDVLLVVRAEERQAAMLLAYHEGSEVDEGEAVAS